MVARGPGAVGCAHCTMLGAEIACAVCKHLVCVRCAANLSTCEQPSGRMFWLGPSGKLIDVDPAGRLGLVGGRWGRLRVVDLRTPRWLPDAKYPFAGATKPVMLEHPRRVVQHAFVDGGEVIVTGSSSEIAIHRIIDGNPVLVGQVPLPGGDLTWLQLCGRYLAARIHGGAQRGITVWRLSDDLTSASDILHIADGIASADMSRDGRYLALGSTSRAVMVRSLDDGAVLRFEDHTDIVSLVRFAADDQLLISADEKHRVVLRPRTANGFAPGIVPVELPD